MIAEYFTATLSDLVFEYKKSYVLSDALRDQGQHSLADWEANERYVNLSKQEFLFEVADALGVDAQDIAGNAEQAGGEKFVLWLQERGN